MNDPSTMVGRVQQYVKYRQGLGWKMSVQSKELLRFARFADSIGHCGPLTTELALRWARSAEGCTRLYQSRRLETVRCLAKYLQVFEPGTEIPPRGILGPAHRRVQPHVYTPEEIAALLKAAALLPPIEGIRPRTYVALIGLMASTGVRTCEALNLERNDLDFSTGVLTIRCTKFRKSRLLPLHPSASKQLKSYAVFRDSYHSKSACPRFLLSQRGGPLLPSVVHWTFGKLRRQAGLESREKRRAPRLYDLRHTFACRRLLEWYREGRDVNQVISWLSTYLGHAKVTDTYWYLTGIPELMEIAAQRFEHYAHPVTRGVS